MYNTNFPQLFNLFLSSYFNLKLKVKLFFKKHSLTTTTSHGMVWFGNITNKVFIIKLSGKFLLYLNLYFFSRQQLKRTVNNICNIVVLMVLLFHFVMKTIG